MANGRDTKEIKRIRNEVLVVLKLVYPAALSADHLLRGLLVLFPALEFDALKRDLHYLAEKGYVEGVSVEGKDGAAVTPWRRRWFRLTAAGIEVADRCVLDPALDD